MPFLGSLWVHKNPKPDLGCDIIDHQNAHGTSIVPPTLSVSSAMVKINPLVHWMREFLRIFTTPPISPSISRIRIDSCLKNPPIWIWESCCWVMVWKRSCPAVSQICNFTRFPGRGMKNPRKTPWVDHQYIKAAILYVINIYIYTHNILCIYLYIYT